ncbi:hypothetical protein [Brevundimonas sp. DWR2-3-1b1]|uniref:hypothetical protein n=1 Tax=unclassified Brevundimonas TaxID=2622653 RepID=UPI003CF0E453
MRRSQFAALIGVSKQQVGKYVSDGTVLLDGADVDVEESLARLEGRLDETKRQRALAMWSGRSTSAPRSATSGAPGAPAKALSGKARHDEARAELAELELAQRKGELLETADVEAKADEAVQALRETMAAGRREDADQICAKFGIPAERATALARELNTRDERALGRFARAMAVLAFDEGVADVETNPVRPEAEGVAA